MVTGTEFGFMSTSTDEAICHEYMDKNQPNVLWEIRCKPESSEGLHSGADVSMLSQFPSEREILFPPMTLLKVEMQASESKPQCALTPLTSPSGAEYVRIVVTPTYA